MVSCNKQKFKYLMQQKLHKNKYFGMDFVIMYEKILTF